MNHDLPRHGGVLRLHGPVELDHLDPVAMDQLPTRQLSRLYTRQLFSYQAEPDLRDWWAVAPVPDLATNVPSTYNMGMGATHRNYVIHLRPGVFWDTTPQRRLTAHDVVRGLKRLGNPVCRPATLPYFTSTIRGMAEFCEGYAAAVPVDASPEDFAAYQNSHDIPGVYVLDDESLVIELVRPALDFVNILALPCATPAPVEYDAFVPGSPELGDNIRSLGPYRVVRHLPGKLLRLERNPSWREDPLRKQYPDAVEVTMEKSSVAQVRRKIQAGQADLAWGCPATEPGAATLDDGLGFTLDPYVVFNLRRVAKAAVRQAVAQAIDKAAIADIYARTAPGTAIRTAGSVVPPGNDAHQEIDPLPNAPEVSRALLAEAGHPDGLELTLVFLDTDPVTEVAQSLAGSLEKANITVNPHAAAQADYDRLLRDPANAEWDLAIASRAPDWLHGNGRAFLQPMFETNPSRGTGNFGQYSDPAIDALIDDALGAVAEPEREHAIWHEVERRVLDDVAVVPILFQRPMTFPVKAPSVRGGVTLPALGYGPDLTTLWLASRRGA